MYYRRKILLALIEVFGGKLKRTDCQKLLFLFCQFKKNNFFDFFPYKYGGFSFLAYQDKKRLTDLGFLSHGEDFKLCTNKSFFGELKPTDREALTSLSSRFKNLQGRALIRHVYLEYPYYTCRSKIFSDLLNSEEIEQIRLRWNKDKSPCLFTIGYEGLTIDAYLNKLVSNNVKMLIDVRRNPKSMKYGFSKSKLRFYVEKAGLEYFHIPALGVPSKLRMNLNNPESYQELFKFYRVQILPGQKKAIEKVKMLFCEYTRIALTCFEADYNFCHRSIITEHLVKMPDFRTRIVHL